MDGLWTGLGDRLAERFIVAVLTPAFVFWAGGLVAWAAPDRWRDVGHWIAHLSTPAAIAVAAGALVVVVASGAVVGRFQLGVIRLLEGYWPARLDRLRDRLVERRTDWVGPAEERVQVLADGLEDRPPNEQEEFARLDERLRRMPESGRRMPTRLGNILRAAEALPRAKYGLDAPKCWPRVARASGQHPQRAQRRSRGARRRRGDVAMGPLVRDLDRVGLVGGAGRSSRCRGVIRLDGESGNDVRRPDRVGV